MKYRLCLIGILLLSLFLGVLAIDWGLPDTWHPDEVMGLALSMAKNKDLNPHRFKRPTLQKYIILSALAPYYIIIKNRNDFSGNSYSTVPKWFLRHVYIIGRMASVFMFMGAVLLTYLVAGLAYNKATGILAALFLSTTMIFVYYSHFAHCNTVVFWICLTLLFAILAVKKGGMKYFALAAFSAGLATGTRYLFPLIVPVLVSGFLANKVSKAKFNYGKIILLAFLLLLVGFVISSPFALITFREFIAGVSEQIDEVAVFNKLTVGIKDFGFIANIIIMPQAIGWPYALLFAISFIYSWILICRKKDFSLLIINSWVLTWYIYKSYMVYSPLNQFVFIAPCIAFLNAKFTYDFILQNKRFRYLYIVMLSAALLSSFVFSLASDILMLKDSRYEAMRWIKNNIDKTDSIEEYGWQVAEVLPYHPTIPEGYNVKKIAYKELPNHFQRLMANKDLLPKWIIDSSLHYGRYLDNPNFPTQSQFYNMLFSRALPYEKVISFETKLHLPRILTPQPEFVNPKIVIFKLKR